MPVDERELDVLITSLAALRDGCRQTASDADACLATLNKIRQVDGANPTDPDTHAAMTQARRNEVYDGCLPAANQLLGRTAESG